MTASDPKQPAASTASLGQNTQFAKGRQVGRYGKYYPLAISMLDRVEFAKGRCAASIDLRLRKHISVAVWIEEGR